MVFFLALAVAVQPSVKPWPIGPGPRYTPPARPGLVAAGKPVGGMHCVASAPMMRLHVELYADRRVVVLPAGIGVADPFSRSGGSVAPRGCSYPVRTLTPTGIVEARPGAGLHLSDFFRIWGQVLAKRRLVSFRSSSPVRAYVDGKRVRGALGAIPLKRHAEIVLEIGAYVPPHPFFLFAGGPS